jgi:DNA-binding LacI/PurR family transcriptional regulator
MKTRSAVTLKDIAEKAGVSITTVSRILNASYNAIPIREDTRQRVFAIASELGYKPNLFARGLRSSHSSLLGVIARDIADPFHIQILQGIHKATTDRDYRLFLGNVDYRPDMAVAYGSMFEQYHADGIIIIGDIEGDEAALKILTNQHQSIVGVTDRITQRQYPGVYSDNRGGTHLALDHLWALGHRRIVCVSDPRNHDGRMRAELYEHYMRERDVQPKVYMIPQEQQAAFEVGRDIFNHDQQPTAIYAASDTFAIYLLQAAYQAGVDIPRQVSIVGYDNIDFTANTIPPLTTIDQMGVQMGMTAANLLLDLVEHNREYAEVDDVIMQPKLVIRQSTSTPPENE